MEYIAILVFILGLPLTYTQLEVKKIENKYPPLGYFKNIDGYNIHYTDIGSGQPVVLLHSQPANERQFDVLKNKLKENYRVISIDRPGMGYSEGPKVNSSERLSIQAEIISKLLQEITQEKPIVVGHSYGGALALSLALHEEKYLKKLILVNTASHPWKGDGVWLPFKIITNPLIGKIFTQTFAMIYGKSVIERSADDNFPDNKPTPGFINKVGAELTLRPATLESYALDAINLKSALSKQFRNYENLSIPITILAGIGDRVTPNKTHSFQLHKDIKHSTLIELNNVEHSIPELNPMKIIEEIQ
ncbi:alpha/beta hydrolase [Pelagibacteraceae bacterium]|nr:alpha/beta hydrolase [Pelagibacteraceae bacterium]